MAYVSVTGVSAVVAARPAVIAQPAAAVRDSAAPYPVRWPSPTLGEYNRAVLSELLGLTDAEIDQLARSGVIGDQLVVDTGAERGAA